MERVNKGEKYWLIHIMWNRIYVTDTTDMHYECDRENWNQGNYFRTEEEAEAMANKLRAVLKGADVIEMPSEEEIKDAQDRIQNDVVFNIRDAYGQQLVYWKAIDKGAELMAEWLKSKIVK